MDVKKDDDFWGRQPEWTDIDDALSDDARIFDEEKYQTDRLLDAEQLIESKLLELSLYLEER